MVDVVRLDGFEPGVLDEADQGHHQDGVVLDDEHARGALMLVHASVDSVDLDLNLQEGRTELRVQARRNVTDGRLPGSHEP